MGVNPPRLSAVYIFFADARCQQRSTTSRARTVGCLLGAWCGGLDGEGSGYYQHVNARVSGWGGGGAGVGRTEATGGALSSGGSLRLHRAHLPVRKAFAGCCSCGANIWCIPCLLCSTSANLEPERNLIDGETGWHAMSRRQCAPGISEPRYGG
jgi:hypothetical protein